MSRRVPEDVLAVLEKVQADQRRLPPVHEWHPDSVGEIDIRIARNGTWYHEGDPIQRDAIVRIFSSILRREDGGWYLVTPAEKLRIEVEDAPFVAVTMTVLEPGIEQKLVFVTNVGDTVVAGPAHPIRVEVRADTGEPSPYVLVRQNMDALIARTVFYDMVEMAELCSSDSDEWLAVRSGGQLWPIGKI